MDSVDLLITADEPWGAILFLLLFCCLQFYCEAPEMFSRLRKLTWLLFSVEERRMTEFTFLDELIKEE